MATSGDVVVIAAEAREFSGLVRKSGTEGFVLIANGPGPVLAGQAVSEAASRTKIRALVSAGFCGALKPEFVVGDIVVADCVLDAASGERYSASQPPVRPAAKMGLVVSMDRVAVTSAEKEELRRLTGACAVEMEAAEVARWAVQLGVPFYCVRAVSDTADHTLVMDFNAYRDKQGRFSRWRIALAAMRKPRCIPALRRLNQDSRIAAVKLGDFLANCQF